MSDEVVKVTPSLTVLWKGREKRKRGKAEGKSPSGYPQQRRHDERLGEVQTPLTAVSSQQRSQQSAGQSAVSSAVSRVTSGGP